MWARCRLARWSLKHLLEICLMQHLFLRCLREMCLMWPRLFLKCLQGIFQQWACPLATAEVVCHQQVPWGLG